MSDCGTEGFENSLSASFHSHNYGDKGKGAPTGNWSISWTAPSSGGDPNCCSYTVSGLGNNISVPAPSTTTGVTLPYATVYSVTVTATNVAGTGPASSPLSLDTGPGPETFSNGVLGLVSNSSPPLNIIPFAIGSNATLVYMTFTIADQSVSGVYNSATISDLQNLQNYSINSITGTVGGMSVDTSSYVFTSAIVNPNSAAFSGCSPGNCILFGFSGTFGNVALQYDDSITITMTYNTGMYPSGTMPGVTFSASAKVSVGLPGAPGSLAGVFSGPTS